MRSKKDKIIELFFQNPTREWHFEEIVKHAGIARSKADVWIKKSIREGLVKKVKKKGEMPYYISNYESPEYKGSKRLFAFSKLYESGFLSHLYSLPKARTIILFGSFSRSDWYKESDIDLFIYGDPEGLRIVDYELKLKKDIQLFICQNNADLKKMGIGLIRNIIKGNLVKGNLDFIKVDIDA